MPHGRLLFVAIGFCAIIGCILFAGPLRRLLLPASKPIIRFHGGQSESIRLHNAIAAIVVEAGYGYPTEEVMQTTYVMQMAMQKGRIDVNLEARLREWPQWYRAQVKAANIVSLGAIFEGSSQFFIIPAWAARQYNIETVFDMREHWQIFKDPESPSKGVFYNGPIGSGCERINAIKLEAYGLMPRYNIVSPASLSALEATIRRCQENRQPVFAFCWAPSALMGEHEWRVLKEPEYSDECWQETMGAMEGKPERPVTRACAYQTVPMEKLVHRSMLRKAPDVVEMLKKMSIGQDALSSLLAWVRKRDVRDWRRAAIRFLREHEDVWKKWVTPEAFERIKSSVASAPATGSSSSSRTGAQPRTEPGGPEGG